jgi:hypothetical protein
MAWRRTSERPRRVAICTERRQRGTTLHSITSYGFDVVDMHKNIGAAIIHEPELKARIMMSKMQRRKEK